MIRTSAVFVALAALSVAGSADAAPEGWASAPSCSFVGQYVMPCSRAYIEAPAGIAWASAESCDYKGQYVMPCVSRKIEAPLTSGLDESCNYKGQYVMPCARRTDGR